MSATTAFCQDIITLKNGDEIETKVTEISEHQIKYKEFDNLDGPVYAVSKSKIFMIKYKNGKKDVFSNYTKEGNKQSADYTGVKKGFIAVTAGFAMPTGDLSSEIKAETGLNINAKFGYFIDPKFGICASFMRTGLSVEENDIANIDIYYNCLTVGGLTTFHSEKINFDLKGEVGYMYSLTETTFKENYLGSSEKTEKDDDGACFILGAGLRYEITPMISIMGNIDYVTALSKDIDGTNAIHITAGVAFRIGDTF